jgi:hypothetical protein
VKEITVDDYFLRNLLPECGYGSYDGKYMKEL